MNAISSPEADALIAMETRHLGWRVENAMRSVDNALACRDVDEASLRLSSVYNTNRLRLAGHAKDFRMRMRRSQLGRLGLATLSFGAEVDIDQAGDRPFVLVTTQISGFSRVTTPDGSAAGGRGFIVIDSAGQPVSKRFSGDSERCNLRIDQAVLDAKCAALLDRPLDRPLRFSPFGANGGLARQRWIGMLQMLLGYVGGAQQALLEPIIHNLEESVLLHLLLEHEHTYSDALRNPCRGLAPRHVRRAEDYIRSHARQALTLESIAAAVGCSVRSLSEGFRQARGTTPMSFLRQVRLEGVRADLSNALPGKGVSELALDWGFNHLGRFATEYRRCFGESPSDTRHRCR